MAKVDITGLDKREVLRALYRNAIQDPKISDNEWMFLKQGGWDPETLSDEDIDHFLKFSIIGRLHLRYLDVDLRGDEVDTTLYDRHNGTNLGAAVIRWLKVLAVADGRLPDEAVAWFMAPHLRAALKIHMEEFGGITHMVKSASAQECTRVAVGHHLFVADEMKVYEKTPDGWHLVANYFH